MIRIFGGELSTLEIVLCVTAALLAFVAIMVFIHCCIQCCSGGDYGKQEREEEKVFFDREYYEEICQLLHRHRQMELQQLEREREEDRKMEEYENLNEPQPETPKMRSRSNSEKLSKLRAELEQYRIDHNIKVRTEQPSPGRRRTWGGLQEDSQFEAVELPNKANVEVQTTETLERMRGTKYLNLQSYETTV